MDASICLERPTVDREVGINDMSGGVEILDAFYFHYRGYCREKKCQGGTIDARGRQACLGRWVLTMQLAFPLSITSHPARSTQNDGGAVILRRAPPPHPSFGI